MKEPGEVFTLRDYAKWLAAYFIEVKKEIEKI